MPKRITKLTTAQRDQMAPWARKWIEIGLSCEPADRPVAEAAYRACYRHAKLDPDVPIVWVQSPLVGAFAASIADAMLRGGAVYGAVGSAVDGAVYGAVGGAVGDAVRSAVDNAVDNAVGSAVYGAVGGAVGDAVRSAVDNAVDNAVRSAVYGAVGSAVDGAVGSAVDGAVGRAVDNAVRSAVYGAVDNAVYGAVGGAVGDAVGNAVPEKILWHYWIGGALWPAWAAYESFFREVCYLKLPDDLSNRGRDYAAAAQSSGYWWPNKRFIIACDRPQFIKRDDAGRLHAENGNAIQWRDGWGIASWHGVTVPVEWLGPKSILTPQSALAEPNMEKRRAACEIVGWERILGELHATVIDADEDPLIGTLVEVDLPDVGRERFLRVTCGTGRKFALAVPPDMPTALAANAWTFDLDGDTLRKLETRT
jgi:hypothetical protein